jgi:hypothetical protein
MRKPDCLAPHSQIHNGFFQVPFTGASQRLTPEGGEACDTQPPALAIGDFFLFSTPVWGAGDISFKIKDGKKSSTWCTCIHGNRDLTING